MDDHLAHLSEDEYYSEEDRKEKEKDKGSAADTKTTVEKPVIKPEDLEPEKADPDKPQPDDPTGERGSLQCSVVPGQRKQTQVSSKTPAWQPNK